MKLITLTGNDTNSGSERTITFNPHQTSLALEDLSDGRYTIKTPMFSLIVAGDIKALTAQLEK